MSGKRKESETLPPEKPNAQVREKPTRGPFRKTVSPRELQITVNHDILAMSLSEAAKAAGSKSVTLHARNTVGFNSVKNVRSNEHCREEMERQGLTFEYYVRKLKEGCEAVTYVKDRDGNLVEVPDYHARHKFVEIGLKILKAFPATKIEVEEMSFEERLFRLEYGDQSEWK